MASFEFICNGYGRCLNPDHHDHHPPGPTGIQGPKIGRNWIEGEKKGNALNGPYAQRAREIEAWATSLLNYAAQHADLNENENENVDVNVNENENENGAGVRSEIEAWATNLLNYAAQHANLNEN